MKKKGAGASVLEGFFASRSRIRALLLLARYRNGLSFSKLSRVAGINWYQLKKYVEYLRRHRIVRIQHTKYGTFIVASNHTFFDLLLALEEVAEKSKEGQRSL